MGLLHTWEGGCETRGHQSSVSSLKRYFFVGDDVDGELIEENNITSEGDDELRSLPFSYRTIIRLALTWFFGVLAAPPYCFAQTRPLTRDRHLKTEGIHATRAVKYLKLALVLMNQ